MAKSMTTSGSRGRLTYWSHSLAKFAKVVAALDAVKVLGSARAVSSLRRAAAVLKHCVPLADSDRKAEP